MSRRRTVSDAEVLAAACRVIARTGPHRATLAEIAAEAGLAAPTLIQRYGSKRALFLALAKAGAENPESCFEHLRSANRSPLKVIYASIDETACLAATPETLANNLAALQNDLADAEFRSYTRRLFKGMLAGYKAILDDAVRTGELAPCDTKGLAHLLQAAIQGSIVLWGFEQRGTAASFIRRDVRLLLEPYLAR
jgi:AcrR family transcriptional regulator